MLLQVIKTEDKSYKIKDFDKAYEYILSVVNQVNSNMVITNKEDYDIQVDAKKMLKEKCDIIKSARINLCKLMAEQFRELEGVLKETIEKLDVSIKEYKYNALGYKKRPTTYTLQVKSTDKDLINQLKNELIERKLYKEVSIKGESDE